MTQAITKEELAWLLMTFNQKRGYEKVRGKDEELQENKQQEYLVLKVVDVETVAKISIRLHSKMVGNIYLRRSMLASGKG